MRINFGDGTLRGNLLAASKLAAMDQKPQSSELFEVAAARIAELEAALDEINAASFREDRTRDNTVMVPIGAWDNAMRVIARS